MPATASLPLFNWLDHRAAGVLLHPTSLPGDFGIGTFGKEARQFIDFLHDAGFAYWQLCPVGPTSYGDSPYQSPSTFAGNPYLIDLLPLSQAGLIRQDALGPLLFLNQEHIDFGGIYRLKRPILRAAYDQFHAGRKTPLPYGDFEAFKSKHASWLDAYALFMALKDHFEGQPWTHWPKAVSSHAAALKSPLVRKLAPEIESHKFSQYLFHGQWKELREYAHRKKVSIIGDIPIFVALDSADVWAHPELFQFDSTKNEPLAVAGCPPDYFSEDGQLWGNPLYDWEKNAADGYTWWKRRLAACFELFDVVRIDHFRGFDTYWKIPFGAPTARTGAWIQGPGLHFFQAVREASPRARIIAEDLGELLPSVLTLRDQTGLPGMAILQFAFGGKADNLYLPHNLAANQVLYPGTHDNDTTRGWYRAADSRTQDHVRRYFRVSGDEIAWDFIRAAYAAVSRLAVFPLQDLLSLGSEARLNTPGEPMGNWSWRYRPAQLEQLHRQSAGYLRELGALYGRVA